MSKIYNEYLRLKKIDSNKLYLFKSGKFYIFVGDDCDLINECVVLKKTPFSKETFKCGFPVDSLEQYLRVFSNHKLIIQVVEEISDMDEPKIVLDFIRKIDINNITTIEAIMTLKRLKDLIK